VDVEDRELGTARAEQLRSVGRRRWFLDLQVDAAFCVQAVLERRVDPRVNRVGLEVEHQGRLPGGARFSTVLSTRRKG
jgi:hypothetical protein